MKILVTGHTGMLGRKIMQSMVGKKDYDTYGVSKTNRLNGFTGKQFNIDLADVGETSRLLTELRPEVIVHTAAYTDLRFCEENLKAAHTLHVVLTGVLAKAKGCKLVYISTDSVFNGQEGSYKENDPTYPLNYYAQSKLEGEWVALRESQSLVIRTNIYGFKEPAGKSLAEWALESFKAGRTISGYSNVMFNPLYTGQLADLVIHLIDMNRCGIMHTGAWHGCSKMHFLRLLAREFGYSESLVNESHYIEDKLIRRPMNTILNVDSLRSILEAPSLESGLKMLKMDYNNINK